MRIDSEFEELLAGVLDGSPDAVRNERLCELLRNDPQLCNEYADLMQLHALLLWREGRAVPSPGASPQPSAPSPTGPAVRSLRSRSFRAAAFGLGVAICLGLFFLLPSAPDADAGPEVVEQLVGWNLDIAQAGPEKRQEIYDSRSARMYGLAAQTSLAPEDRDLAQTLVDTGGWLVHNDDPMAEAERFGVIADKLLARLDSASQKPDSPHVVKLADSYRRVTEVGVSVNLERALSVAPADPKHNPKLDRLIAGDSGRANRLEELLERHPDASWKAIHRAIKGHHRNKK